MPLDIEFCTKHYLATLVNQKNIAYQVVQTSTHWAFLLVGAVLAVLFNNPKFPNRFSLLLVSALLLFVVHIAIRVGKGYINQIRWNTLERELIGLLDVDLTDNVREERLKDFQKSVRIYHWEWQSPVSAKRLFLKLLFELGFFIIFLGVMSLLIYLYSQVSDVTLCFKRILFIVVGVLVFGEIIIFRFFSGYLRKVYYHPGIKF